MTAKHTLLFAALAAALFAATPAFAQDTPPDTTETDASVPKDRLVDAYVDTLFDGDEVAAGEAVTALRTGGDFTVTSTVTRQATNPDGTLATNPDGTPKMETVTVETPIANANGPMGWGEVDHSLGLAQAMVDSGKAASFDEALQGTATTTTVTNADGTTTTTTTYSGGLLQMRADGMGWGQIAKELGFKSLGAVKSGRSADAEETTAVTTASAKGHDAAKVAADSHGKSAEHKPDHAAKADRITGKPEKVERIAKVERPAKIDRPDRPERPSKPERIGRP
ncbi:hypothetical protein [Lysobacter terrae]